MKRLVMIAALTTLTTGLVASAKAPDQPETRPVSHVAVDRSTTTTSSTTTTTVPPTTTTTLLPLGFEPKCPHLIQPARDAGFPEDELAHLDRLAWRESRCDIDWRTGQPRCAHNPDDPAGGSWGAWQINQSWAKKNRWNPHPAGYLGNLGILDHHLDLCSWDVNAKSAKALYDYSLAKHGYDKRWWPWKL